MGYVSTWMGDCLSSTPAVGCVWVGISLCHQTFVNSSALFRVSDGFVFTLGTKTPFGLVCLQTFMNCGMHRVMSACLINEVMRQWATLVLGCVTASVHCSCL